MGRHRSFDPATALEAALGVFWAKGFEGTSLVDLTEAMGISRPSLYAAFGDKEALFHQALRRYDEHYMGFFDAALAEPDIHATLRHIFSGFIALNASDTHPHGSPDTVGALMCSAAADSVRTWLLDRRERREAALAERFARAIADRQYTARADPASLAAYVITLLHGMDVQAAAGASRRKLEQIASFGLATLLPPCAPVLVTRSA